MTERQWIWINVGNIIAFLMFVLLSLSTEGQRAIVVLTETIGVLALVFAIITLIYGKAEFKWFAVCGIACLAPWVVFAIGYETGITATTNYYHLGFMLFYIVMIASIVFLKISFQKLHDEFKLIPVFLLFFHAILLIYIMVIHIWWLLPF
ncbi:hypothetical protein GCM10010954_13900 [Halobacillus andaensis]|uniref:Uncharacterized protein n=2 Tax=Halobacillus andaensis TaxID=1176239 RepID=A0A917EV45_HALAA|nr:hypothetical protein GCM10010954_13900 [Halobacillus andaensis]